MTVAKRTRQYSSVALSVIGLLRGADRGLGSSWQFWRPSWAVWAVALGSSTGLERLWAGLAGFWRAPGQVMGALGWPWAGLLELLGRLEALPERPEGQKGRKVTFSVGFC